MGVRQIRPADSTTRSKRFRYIATHEAGHAVSAVVLGLPLDSVDIRRRTLSDGRISVGFSDTGHIKVNDVKRMDEKTLISHLSSIMAGPIAERRSTLGATNMAVIR